MKEQKDPKTHTIIGAGMEVHSQLGRGFLEAVYQEAFALELSTRNIPFAKEVRLPIYYKGQELPTVYRADFICYGNIIVELKAIKQLGGIETSQITNYLRATKFPLGMLLNFGSKSLEYERFANTR